VITAIEPLITRLVQQAPALDAATIDELRDALALVGTPLALAISRIIELVGEQLVDPGVALPALAEACATLVAATRGQADASALEAARFRVDTLTPMPDLPPRIAVPDVLVTDLRRKN
jgi:hypothetical protein